MDRGNCKHCTSLSTNVFSSPSWSHAIDEVPKLDLEEAEKFRDDETSWRGFDEIRESIKTEIDQIFFLLGNRKEPERLTGGPFSCPCELRVMRPRN